MVAAVQDLIKSAPDAQIATLAEQLPDYLISRGIPSDWLNDALAQRVPGLDGAQAEARLKAKQFAVLSANHDNLTRAMQRHTAPPPLLDPYNPSITSEPYRNGEPFHPSAE